MYFLRCIQPQDNAAMASIIREVSQEYGLAPESGFAVADPTVDQLFEVYQQPKSQYWVVTNQQNEVFGGGGIAPLQGAAEILEIQKMYFLPQLRGQGLAKQLLQQAFEFAQQQHCDTLYLETTAKLKQALQLYEKLGFEYLDAPLGDTGHSHACEIWMKKSLG